MENKLVVMFLLEGVIMLAPLLFALADLLSGIRKAKQRGETLTSSKYRKTITKLAKYYNVMLALGLIDALQLACIWYLNNFSGWDFPVFPWLTMLGAFGIGAIETKSIMEPANEKEASELEQVGILAKAIAKHKTEPEEIAKAVIDYLKTDKNDK